MVNVSVSHSEANSLSDYLQIIDEMYLLCFA